MSSFSTVPRKGPVSLKGVASMTTPATWEGRPLIARSDVIGGGGGIGGCVSEDSELRVIMTMMIRCDCKVSAYRASHQVVRMVGFSGGMKVARVPSMRIQLAWRRAMLGMMEGWEVRREGVKMVAA